jgi:hypothetical protein
MFRIIMWLIFWILTLGLFDVTVEYDDGLELLCVAGRIILREIRYAD